MTTAQTAPKKKKAKGPIRYEAVIPVTVIMGIGWFYMTRFFDQHVKQAIEYVGTKANGAEVNVASVHTSFIKGSFQLNGLQVTDVALPKQNLIEIGNVHFQYMWDALLRMKFVVEDASITDLRVLSPRKTPGKVLPPSPKETGPSKMEELQGEVLDQVKDRTQSNVLSNLIAILEGGDPKEQLQNIREELKSEARLKEMVSDVKQKQEVWQGRVKTLSDTSKIKKVEQQVQLISKEKNVLNQAKGVKELGDLLKDVQGQYKDIQKASKELTSEVQAVAQYPKEIEGLIKTDIESLKNRFSVPSLDFKDIAMSIFGTQFATYIAQARKYQALAKQYIPEKKADEDPIIPPARSEGKNYEFPITTGYPLFWLKRAAISSQGTPGSYNGNIKGELTNVTTSPKVIGKPLVLNFQGDFPDVKVAGVKGVVTIDHTKAIAKQTLLLQINSFAVPEKMFVSSKDLTLGIRGAEGSTTVQGNFSEGTLTMNWIASFAQPQYVIDSKSKLGKEILTNILTAIPVITVNGKAEGAWKKLSMHLSSNLGDELADGLKREVGAKVAEAQDKIKALVDEKINGPKNQLMSALGGNKDLVSQLGNVSELYKKNEGRIKAEIEKLKKSGTKDLGKKLLKGIKL